ncbi:PAS domain-containing sensor histidine kinase [Roseomonas sp. JC162]|uniref:histidine kinase n=1 Tax=Neoroseomonas marina TaxID=1232220 RepID=A0A848EGE8_9PROT|nr:PAS domain-containing sensor histidine kinase [Neoroseomonas marina]NMJ42503.1 PAS domain-containing sensor histidine kinase [Neoroseomonas marina]
MAGLFRRSGGPRRVASPPAEVSGQAPAPRKLTRRITDALLGGAATIALALVALGLGIATFALLSGGTPLGPTSPGQVVGIVLANLVVLLLLAASVIARFVRMWAERREGSAGSRLHVRLVLLFGVVAVGPSILVAGFAAVFFNLGIQAWFSDRVRDTLEASLVASRAYLEEHRNTIRADILAIANDLNRAAPVLLPDNGLAFARLLATHTAIRGLTESLVVEPTLGQVVASAGLTTGSVVDAPPSWALEQARAGEVVVMPGEGGEGRVRAMVQLNIPPGLLLVISRPVDPGVLEHMRKTELAFQEYDRLDRNRGDLQITFVVIFAIATLLVLLGAVLLGLLIANRIARPISRLITAAERVRTGDLSTRVHEGKADDEVASLSRAFNRMTSQLSAQRSELMEAYRQIDERRRFTETVLSGVTAGVIGLDAEGRVNLPNRSASGLLGVDLDAAIGLPLAGVAPEFAPLIEAARAQPDRPQTNEIRTGPPSARRTLIARLGAEMQGGRVEGYVLTFDDITELLSAQRKAAWADVARRIAHEIKNPLTPIQLSAERLKRRYLKQIQDDPDTFRQCTDTIVRQVGDIGRMVDEFSAFARMPQPVIRPEDVNQLLREALVLQRDAHPEIAYVTRFADPAPRVPCDRRLIGQALTNLLQNAADAVAMRAGEGAGRIEAAIDATPDHVTITVTDDGVGLPTEEDRDRLTEPYVTHKPKGTGLGLAIVKKIMEDHGGRLVLEDREDGPGARVTLILPVREAGEGASESTGTAEGAKVAHGA